MQDPSSEYAIDETSSGCVQSGAPIGIPDCESQVQTDPLDVPLATTRPSGENVTQQASDPVARSHTRPPSHTDFLPEIMPPWGNREARAVDVGLF